ncbi:hypothetical protein P154DRAFT_107178 [Amniculicola lignicola CBS 123094]|uniref:Myb-like DNA-binding domain-containing protein n=1 Tax=Amniculicola lignicola CBS 123094 TaxID=1392246 RepID=A0A6A5VWB5_9PLEO|nr:hypothetical protein P154DRAFT_107178 [Amniculicola lignicola CBS 123094]
MPSDEDNVKYLYTVLTAAGPPSVDWAAVGTALDLKPGAVSKRWSRLKQGMEKGNPPATAHPFLWLCMKHSTREKAPDWHDIAQKCNTTAGAASKRYSRMKQAFENGAPVPTLTDDTAGAKRKRGPAEKKSDEILKNEADTEGNKEGEQFDEKPTAKKAVPKKRAPAKKRAINNIKDEAASEIDNANQVPINPNSNFDNNDELIDTAPTKKRARVTKPAVKKPAVKKPTGTTGTTSNGKGMKAKMDEIEDRVPDHNNENGKASRTQDWIRQTKAEELDIQMPFVEGELEEEDEI